MKRYPAGSIVPWGVYWSPGRLELRTVSRSEDVLRGIAGPDYVRVPVVAIPLLALVGLVAGGLFVLALPFGGAGLLVWYGAIGAWRLLRLVGVEVAGLFAEHSFPGRSGFTGRRPFRK